MAALTTILILIERQGQVVSNAVLRGSSSLSGGREGCNTASSGATTTERPPLSSLINYTITSNNTIKTGAREFVENLLDFAIIGHPKTATSFTMEWLSSQPEILMYTHELHSLQSNNSAEFVQLMYDLPQGNQFKRGYKAPRDIANIKALDLLAEYWPKANLIVGLRHPGTSFLLFLDLKHHFVSSTILTHSLT